MEWLVHNKLKLNANKTVYINFNQPKPGLQDPIQIKYINKRSGMYKISWYMGGLKTNLGNSYTPSNPETE